MMASDPLHSPPCSIESIQNNFRDDGRRGDSSPADFTPDRVSYHLRCCNVRPAKYRQHCRGKAACQHKHRVGCSGWLHSNTIISSGQIEAKACQPSWTHASPVPTAMETELWFALVKPFLGAGLSPEPAQGKRRCKPWEFAIKEICVAGECKVSWEWPFYWVPDAVE